MQKYALSGSDVAQNFFTFPAARYAVLLYCWPRGFVTPVLQVEKIIEEKEITKQGFSLLHDIPGITMMQLQAAIDRCSSQLVRCRKETQIFLADLF